MALVNNQCPGDLVAITAAIHCLHEQYPGKYLTTVRSPHPAIFENNPHVAALGPGAWDKVEMHCPLINASNHRPVHFMDAWTQNLAEQLGITLTLTTNKPFLYLTDWEKEVRPAVLPQRGKYALICAGRKGCYTAKHPGSRMYQEIVNRLRGKVQFVQVGSAGDHHPPLEGVVNLVGKTSVRDLIRLAYHCEFGVGAVTFLHHVCAAFRKPYFCFNSREPNAWIQYPTSQIFGSNGLLPCNREHACWVNKADPNDTDTSRCALPVLVENEWVPKCLAMIDPAEVVARIERLYEGGTLTAEPKLSVTVQERIIPDDPSLGLVVTTYGNPAYVALHLENRKRHFPDVPVLVVDDCSPDEAALVSVCVEYGADFVSNPKRLGHQPGDLSGFTHGLTWAHRKGLDLVVKQSRTWLPHYAWVDDFKALAVKAQYPTYSNRCDNYNFGFRSECLGMHVASWYPFVSQIKEAIGRGDHGLVEAYLDQQVAQRIPLCAVAQAQQVQHPGHMQWDMLGTNRHAPPPNTLWHDVCDPAAYASLASLWGLSFKERDFTRKT